MVGSILVMVKPRPQMSCPRTSICALIQCQEAHNRHATPCTLPDSVGIGICPAPPMGPTSSPVAYPDFDRLAFFGMVPVLPLSRSERRTAMPVKREPTVYIPRRSGPPEPSFCGASILPLNRVVAPPSIWLAFFFLHDLGSCCLTPTFTMAPYFGLRGTALSRAIMTLVVAPAFITYGYNLSLPGGLLTLESFNNQFPRMDTIHTTGAQQHQNSLIQGRWLQRSDESGANV